MEKAKVVLTKKFREGLQYAAMLHCNDFRKGTGIPYIAHLLSVCSLVLYSGGREEEAVAALLHDALEDHPQETSPEELKDRFGEEVTRIIEGCTDTPKEYREGPKPPWRERKEKYLKHLRDLKPSQDADLRVLRVALADKLDNVRSMVADYRCYRQKGQAEAFWNRFNAKKEEQLWFLRELLALFNEKLGNGKTSSTGAVVDEKIDRSLGNDVPIPPYFLEEFEQAVQELGQRT